MRRHEDTRSNTRTQLSSKHAVLGAAIAIFASLAVIGPARADDSAVEWKPERAPNGPTMVVIGLQEQRAQVYRNGVRIASTPVSTGKPGHETPTGLFSILEKKREHYSNLYNNAPMPNMQRLTWGGVALHAGKLPGYPASHGCVRLPREFSDKLFQVTSKGTLVAVVESFPEMAVLDMARAPFSRQIARYQDAELPSPAAGSYGPVNVVLSTAEGSMVVMRNGVEIARAPVDVSPGSLGGERLYVGRHDGHWEELPTDGPLVGSPAAAFAAGELRVDPAFGAKLDPLLVPGTTVMITDRPLGNALPMPMPNTAIASTAGEMPTSVDAAP